MAPVRELQIRYYAPDDTMGDNSSEACMAYRRWAREELMRAYPQHHVAVVDAPSLDECWTSDEDAREEIQDFCSRLWDRCPWDWEA